MAFKKSGNDFSCDKAGPNQRVKFLIALPLRTTLQIELIQRGLNDKTQEHKYSPQCKRVQLVRNTNTLECLIKQNKAHLRTNKKCHHNMMCFVVVYLVFVRKIYINQAPATSNFLTCWENRS